MQKSNVVSDFATILSTRFKAGMNLSIVVGGGRMPGYDKSTRELSLPYSYLASVVRAQAEIVEDRRQALELGMNMVEYTLYHLFAHVLLDDLSADADDDAEAISTWIMLTSWPNGGEEWFASAQAFGKASQLLDGPLSDYWHEHSLYKSRQQKIECAILGNNPDRYEPLLRAVLEPQARRSHCVAYWNELDSRVGQQLAPVMKNP